MIGPSCALFTHPSTDDLLQGQRPQCEQQGTLTCEMDSLQPSVFDLPSIVTPF